MKGAAVAVQAVKLRRPSLIDFLGTSHRPQAVGRGGIDKVGGVIQDPMDGNFHQPFIRLLGAQQIGGVIPHQAAVVAKAVFGQQIQGYFAQFPTGGAVAGRGGAGQVGQDGQALFQNFPFLGGGHGRRRFVHIAVMPDFVAAPDNIPHQGGMGFGHIARHIETAFDAVGVQQIQDAGGGHAGAIFGHGQQAGQLGKIGIAAQPRRHPVHIEGQHSHALGSAGPDAGHSSCPLF